MKARKILVVLVLAVFCAGSVVAQEETRREKRKGRRKGATSGAVVGLAMGALTGDAELAVAGAAAGAVAGGVAGSWYDYDQANQDNRTQMMADAIAGSKGGDPAPGETVGDVGRRHFQDLAGDWNLDIWYLGLNGQFETARGTARGLSAGDNAMRVIYQNIVADSYEETVTGQSLLNYEPGQGFLLEGRFDIQDDVVKGIGEYLVDRNTYIFYLIEGEGEEMVTGGVLRSNGRIEVRIVSPSLWIAETYTFIQGAEEKVQTYRFTRP
jgi:uncharacterized membrane protein